ncbi:MAG: ADP-ribosyltransferase [Methanobacteriaceae archaeon]
MLQELRKIFDFLKYGGIWNSYLEKKYGIKKENFEIWYKSLENGKTKLQKQTILYRGIKNKYIENYEVGQQIMNKGYRSTSFDISVAKKYAGKNGIVIYINAGRESQGVYMRQYSKYPEDFEWLLLRNSILEVFGINAKEKEVYTSLKI